jgi:polysaccharide pyruvyl transferase CsaB
LLQDATSFRSLFYYYSLVRAAKAGDARVVGYAQGIGPLRRRISRFFAKATVRRCDAFIARDEATLELLNAWRLKGVQVHLGADPVFDWPSPKCEDVAECQSKLAAPDECLLGVSLREPLSEASLKSLATAILELPPRWRAVVWVMSPEDVPVSRSFTHLLGDRGRLIPWSGDLERLLAGLAACEAVLAMRLHAGIFAAVAERPLALLAYDPKVVALGMSLSVPLLGTSPVSYSEASEALTCLVGMRGRPNAEQMARLADLRRRCRIAPSIIKELIFAGKLN